MYIVYRHISPSNKVYIGITSKSAKVRWNNGYGYQRHQPLFWNAILKYGWDNFEHEVIFKDLTKLDAKLIEIDLIYYYKKIGKSYNITDGGEGTLGRPNSEHARKLISAAQKKKSIEQYTLDGKYIQTFESMVDASKAIGKSVYKNNRWTLARGLVKACKNGVVAYGFRWKYTDEKELKIAINKSIKPIVQLTLNGQFIAKFNSAVEAEEKTGINHKLISPCCRGKRKTTNGYKWMFYTDYVSNNCNSFQLNNDVNDCINKDKESRESSISQH